MAILKAIANINRMHMRQVHLCGIIMVFKLFPPFQTNFMYMYTEIHM